jgi:hypothetical protein
MKSPFVRSNFRRLANNTFVRKAKTIQKALSHEVFVNVQPAPALMLPLIDEMQNLLNQMEHNGLAAQSQLDTLREYITQLLSMQTTAVNLLANGDLVILKASGFDLNIELIQSIIGEWNNTMMPMRAHSIKHSA